MTITYPRDMPDPLRLQTVRFDPRYAQVQAATRGGLVQVANVGRDLWTMNYETVLISEREAFALTAWLASLRGGARTFKAWHPLRRFVLGYPRGYSGLIVPGGAAFNGAAVLDGVGAQFDTIDLTGLPYGFALAPGDMLSFAFGSGRQALHRIIEPASANGIGAVTVAVEPAVIPGFSTGAAVSFTKPWCKAVVDAASISVSWQTNRRAVIGFGATQVLT